MKKNKLLLHKQILAAVLSGGILLLPNWGYALPQGGQVVAGTGSISTPGGEQMNITGSGNVAIDWNSFNVAQGESVKFSGMQAVLNYVTGNTKSEIFGNISGSGVHVFLVNPNGILFGATASVNVGELTASTRTIDNRKSFDGTAFSTLSPEAAQKVRGDIINLGELTADKILLEGDNISLLNAHMLKSSGNGNITLRADNKVTVGYEVTDKTTINVGDDAPGGHTVSDYTTGTGTKGSTVLAGAAVQDLRGNSKNITDAMLVHDIYELQAIDKNINGDYIQGDYMLAGDIDADVTKRWNSGSGFNPIGNFTSMPFNIGGFNGSLDGAGFVIKDLHININTADGTQSNAGLFDVLNTNAFVHNLTLQDGSITNYTNSSGGSVGSIAGENLGSLKNVFNIEMEISSQNDSANIGGIVGYNKGTVTDAHNSGSVNDKTNTSARIGGIAGYNDNGGVISYSDNSGAVTGKGEDYLLGGIVGSNKGDISNTFNNQDIKSVGESSWGVYIGGIAGENYGNISDSYNKGNISDNDINGYDMVLGGIAGYNEGAMDGVYNSGNIEGQYYLGGIAGKSYDGSIKNAYNTGLITGNGYDAIAAGIVAENGAEIKNVYNTGKIVNGYNIVADGSGISNAYYAVRSGDTILGYKKFGSGTLLTLAEFGKAFEKGLDTASKDSWKFYNGYTDPLLKGFLKKITIDGDSITGGDTVYNGSEQNAGLSGLADGILVVSKKNAGDYDLNDLLYSGQDGYDIEIVNDGTKFIINKAQLTVTADGVEIDANSVLPDFTGSISGLVGGERWEDLGVELDSDLHFTTDADGKTAGKFAINGSLDKTLANYEIKQADSNAAALVVNKNDKPPQPPDLSNLPQEGIYQNALVNLAVAERENRPEQQSIKRRVTDSRISDKEEQVKVTIEGDGIKTE
ncbi:filamentous hemagglutinin N-terminal domain-containing protein [Phascolarctobacterium faecium]|uniref:two-partner secretion domain-containing protein n=1 Tax=Phascolarctobacterium faecium TaxID=33025 RepID=UPI003AF19B42